MISGLVSALVYLLTLLPGFERELRLMALLVRRSDTVVDIGASIGVYSLTLAALVGRRGRVHAVEPRPSAAARLALWGQSLRLRALRVHPVAAGATAGRDVIRVPGRRWAVPGRSYLSAGALHHRFDDGLRVLDEHPVRRVLLDDLVAAEPRPPVRFVKIDVEGGERDALLGAAGLLTVDRPVVLCEVEERHARRFGYAVRDIADLLAGHRYRQIPLGRFASPGGRNQLWAPVERADEVLALIR